MIGCSHIPSNLVTCMFAMISCLLPTVDQSWTSAFTFQGLVSTLHEGDDFGELALVNDAPRAATIILREDNCHFLRVDKRDFNRILKVGLEIGCIYRLYIGCSFFLLHSGIHQRRLVSQLASKWKGHWVEGRKERGRKIYLMYASSFRDNAKEFPSVPGCWGWGSTAVALHDSSFCFFIL